MKRKPFTVFYAIFVAVASFSVLIAVHSKKIKSPTIISTNTESNVSAAASSDDDIFPLDLNSATLKELVLIDGIGESIAQRIIDYRMENDGFSCIEELYNIYGISDATFNKLSAYVYIKNPKVTTVTAATTTLADESSVFSGRIELNSGTLEDFASIPILTYEQAQAIINLRDTIHYFSHYYELLYAEGFDEKLVAALGDYVYVEGQND